MNQPFLFVALDGLKKKTRETLTIAEQLLKVEGDFGFKVNLDYLLQKGIKAAVAGIRQFGKPIFTDLKMWNGKRTMASVAEDLVGAGVDYLNVYALADDQLSIAFQIANGSKTKILGLTVLTHYTEGYCQKHFRRSLAETVRHFAEVALDAGCHGIILPGTALEVVHDLKTIKVVPGVRPKWYEDSRHEQVTEPREAVEKGANILVCGSPIMKSSNKIEALKKVLLEM